MHLCVYSCVKGSLWSFGPQVVFLVGPCSVHVLHKDTVLPTAELFKGQDILQCANEVREEEDSSKKQ